MANPSLYIIYVEIVCKTIWKSLRKSTVKVRAKLLLTYKKCKTQPFPTIFPIISHPLFYTLPIPINPPLFNNSTAPTNTTINNLIERK